MIIAYEVACYFMTMSLVQMMGALEECNFCNSLRYVVHSKVIDRKQKRVAMKSILYLPIIPRLQIMFASMHSVSQMTQQHTNIISSGMIRYSSDGKAWKHFDIAHPDFAAEPKNVMLGLCSDGFTCYIQLSAVAYSC